jgi:hypothetical protein
VAVLTIKCTRAGCSTRFPAKSADETFCTECRKTVRTFRVALTAAQQQQVESLAAIRGVAAALQKTHFRGGREWQ